MHFQRFIHIIWDTLWDSSKTSNISFLMITVLSWPVMAKHCFHYVLRNRPSFKNIYIVSISKILYFAGIKMTANTPTFPILTNVYPLFQVILDHKGSHEFLLPLWYSIVCKSFSQCLHQPESGATSSLSRSIVYLPNPDSSKSSVAQLPPASLLTAEF